MSDQPAVASKVPAQLTAFTSESARANARKRWDAVRRAKEEAEKPKPLPEPPAKDPYTTARLKRIRAQLDRIDAMMMLETDPAKLDRLASAQARLAEQERVARGEPLPGSRRPAPDKPQAHGPQLVQTFGPPPKHPKG